MKKKCGVMTGAIALLLTGCGGGGSDSPVAAAPPTAVSPSPTAPTPPPATVITVPAPVTPPVTNSPAPPAAPPAGSPPSAPQPPAPPPQPAEGTYILGKIVKAAMWGGQQNADRTAYETDPDTNRADRGRQQIYLGYYPDPTAWRQYSYPLYYYNYGPNPKYPYGEVSFDVGYSNAGYTTLGRTVKTYGNEVQKPLIRKSGDFEIRDDDKFIIDTTAAEWRGVEGEPYFLQFQISSFHPKGATQGESSDHIFKLCLHQYTATVRRLSCTLHNKDNGEYRGVQVLDDSRGLGVTEYLPPND